MKSLINFTLVLILILFNLSYSEQSYADEQNLQTPLLDGISSVWKEEIKDSSGGFPLKHKLRYVTYEKIKLILMKAEEKNLINSTLLHSEFADEIIDEINNNNYREIFNLASIFEDILNKSESLKNKIESEKFMHCSTFSMLIKEILKESFTTVHFLKNIKIQAIIW